MWTDRNNIELCQYSNTRDGSESIFGDTLDGLCGHMIVSTNDIPFY